LLVGGKKLLGFKTTKVFLIQFVQPLCHTSAAWIALFACAMLMPQDSIEEQYALLACAPVTPEKPIDHQAFQRANKRSYHAKPGPTCRKKKKPEKKGARERTKAEAELPSKFQVKPYSLTFFFRISSKPKRL